MGAIIKNYGVGDACKMAVLAGVDMLAICADPDRIREGYNAVLHAVKNGIIQMDRIDASIERIATGKSQLTEPLSFDPVRLEELSTEIADLNDRLAR